MNWTYSGIERINGRGAVCSRKFNATEEYYREMKNALKIRCVKNSQFVRIGRATHDGGYLMLDDFVQEGGGVILFWHIN